MPSVILSLALVPVSIVASVMLWGDHQAAPFIPPAAAFVAAATIAGGKHNARNATWMFLAVQVAVMAIVALS